MFVLEKDIKYTIFIYLIICIGLYLYRPSFLFNKDDSFKQFGTHKDETVMPFWLLTLLLSIIVYFFMVTKSNQYI